MKRRHFFTALGSACVAGFAGCTSTADETDDPTATADDDTPSSDDTPAGPDTPAGDPTTVVESFVRAAVENDTAAARASLHPSHPFHPENRDGDLTFGSLFDGAAIAAVETERVAEDPSAATVLDRVPGTAAAFEEEELADLLDGERSALVSATVTFEDHPPVEYLFVGATRDGEWRILWQGEVPTTRPDPAFDVYVVDRVEFTGDDRARVHLVADPVADSVTVESVETTASTTTDTVGSATWLSVGLDPAGDELVVTATLDGESTVVHRERYPPDERAVDDVTFDTDPEDSLYDAVARVTFNDVDSDARVTAAATRTESEVTFEPLSDVTFLDVGIDPGGDEVTVTVTEDGETTEIHRERYHG